MSDVYVRISPEAVWETREPFPGVNVDLDANGNPVGVEVLSAVGVKIDGQLVPSSKDEAAVECVARTWWYAKFSARFKRVPDFDGAIHKAARERYLKNARLALEALEERT